mmetsp:Transcript_71419/g.209346  ORF Transcript_71419/g.209346 Transcript_71419/m.209346 type:complete len:292 (+) Transcript_71419:1001-1876(+)
MLWLREAFRRASDGIGDTRNGSSAWGMAMLGAQPDGGAAGRTSSFGGFSVSLKESAEESQSPSGGAQSAARSGKLSDFAGITWYRVPLAAFCSSGCHSASLLFVSCVRRSLFVLSDCHSVSFWFFVSCARSSLFIFSFFFISSMHLPRRPKALSWLSATAFWETAKQAAITSWKVSMPCEVEDWKEMDCSRLLDGWELMLLTGPMRTLLADTLDMLLTTGGSGSASVAEFPSSSVASSSIRRSSLSTSSASNSGTSTICTLLLLGCREATSWPSPGTASLSVLFAVVVAHI